jgi:hypothetical protein
MKKTLTGVVALLAGAFVAHSQGTVSMANYLVLSKYIYVSYNGTKLGGTSGAPAGTATANVGKGGDWTVALYGNVGLGDASSTLLECTVAGGGNATATFAPGAPSDATAGTWASSVIAQIPNTTLAGQGSTVQLDAWYNAGGTITTYAAATVKGQSALGNVTSPGGTNPGGGPAITPPNLPALGNFNVIGTIPEPSTIALGVMGASGMLLRLRRKK